MTLREALQSVNLPQVYKLIYKKDLQNVAACDRHTLEECNASYERVVKELLSKPKTKAYTMPWLVRTSTDPFTKKKYVEVCFLNPKYVAPAKGLKPWGGKNPPKGCYNINLNKHNRIFASGFTPWRKVIDTPIVIEAKCSITKAVAEILWEMTFYGWTDASVKNKVEEIMGKINEAKNDVKNGKYTELSASKDGGFKIVIPDSVSKEIKNIIGNS